MKEPKLFEKKNVFLDSKEIKEDKKKVLEIKEIEKDKKNAKKRVDIAARLILLRDEISGKDAESDKNIVNSILKELKNYTGGLILSEIETLNQISKKYNATGKIKHKLQTYKSKHQKELRIYECPTIGASKLKPPLVKMLANFTQLLELSFDKEPIQIKFRDIKIRFDLYHRDRSSTLDKITEYALLSIDQLEKNQILINQHNELVDGYLRLMAIKRLMKNSEDFNINVIKIQTNDDDQLKQAMYHINSQHGQPISKDKKEEYAQELKENLKLPNDKIAEIIGVSRQTIDRWTKRIRLSEANIRKDKILKLNRQNIPQAQIAQMVGVSQGMVSKIITNANVSKTNNDILNPSDIFVLNYWHLGKAKKSETIKEDFFGQTPEVYLENLLYYHTEPSEVVVDLFAGRGTTSDVSNRMGRKCICYDRAPFAGKEHIIKKWNVMDGLPNDLPDAIDLVFLDPPYWIQAAGKYSREPEDLGNMTLKKYNQAMQKLFDNLKRIKIKRLAFLVRPSTYENGEFIFVDHTLEFHEMISDEFDVVARYVLASPSNSWHRLLDKAKISRKCLMSYSDLVVYEKKD